MIDHVLGRFTPEERTDIQDAIRRSVEGIEVWLSEGLEAAMNRINPKG
jgi:PTH1 family peptidyl-tRNA hydrolase